MIDMATTVEAARARRARRAEAGTNPDRTADPVSGMSERAGAGPVAVSNIRPWRSLLR